MKTVKQYMDKSRSKLLAEFKEWYRVCYVGGEVEVEEEEKEEEVFQETEPKVWHILKHVMLFRVCSRS